MAPFIIHAKDSGAGLRGLTQGVMQGLELRRQWEQDERQKVEDARKDEEWRLSKELLGQQKQAAALANEMAGLEIGHAKYLQKLRQSAYDAGRTALPPTRTRNVGPGQAGATPQISALQQDAYNRLSKYDPELALMDSWWQGVATDPEITAWMENFVARDKAANALFLAGEKYQGLTRKEWQTQSTDELKSLKKQVHGQMIGGFLADPRNHPTPDTYDAFFPGLHPDNWAAYKATFESVRSRFDNAAGDEAELDKLTLELEEAETSLYNSYAQDLWWARAKKATADSGLEKKLEQAMGDDLTATLLTKDFADDEDYLSGLGSGDDTAKQKRAYRLWRRWKEHDRVGGSNEEHEKRQQLILELGAWDNGVADHLERQGIDRDMYRQLGEEREAMYQNAVEHLHNPERAKATRGVIRKVIQRHLDTHGAIEEEDFPAVIAALTDPKRGNLPKMGLEFYGYEISRMMEGMTPAPSSKVDTPTGVWTPTVNGVSDSNVSDASKDGRPVGDPIAHSIWSYETGKLSLMSFTDFRIDNYGDGASDAEAQQDKEWLAGDPHIGYEEAGDWMSPFTLEKTYSPAIRLGVGTAEELWDELASGQIGSQEELERRWKAKIIDQGVDPSTVPDHMLDLSMRSTARGTQMEKITPALVRDAVSPTGEFSKWLAETAPEFSTPRQASMWLNATPERQANVLQAVKNMAGHAEGMGWLGRGMRKTGAVIGQSAKGAWTWLFDDEAVADFNMNIKDDEWRDAYRMIEAADKAEGKVLPFGGTPWIQSKADN